ncbi:DUF1156 domain-containing protein [Picosynechococcus sp. NKBG042902]|uniref:DUF1156 domain-containing protein n=1 Tax=Picosynechococcus sp. NKBG042902 TaxID=490193 RepID=UPI0009FDD6AE|nr:DUF1156 domain-containing protein [Picosynechococcus sp. NKBG042902]
MTTPQRKQLFIEKIFPVNLLNQQVYFENGGNPFKGLHRWYSRKPLSFSRASVLGSLLPADVTMEEFEYLLGLERARKNENEVERDDRHKRTRLYKTPPSPERVKRVQELCEQVWGDKTPAVLDAFAGGGSIPFEAARYGLRVFASDLNPVAVVTMKAAIEFPLMFGAELQRDIDKWVQWVGQQAEERLKEFFPSSPAPLAPQSSPPTPNIGGEATEQDGKSPRMGDLGGGGEKIQNYLWAHTVQCPHCQSTVPLSPNWWLSKTSNYAGAGKERKVTSDWCAVKPVPNPAEKRVDFALIKGKKGKGNTIQTPDGDFDPNDFSTMSRGVAKCLNCEEIIENEFIMQAGCQQKMGHQLYAVAFKRGQGSLDFRTPNSTDLSVVEIVEEVISKKKFQRPDLFPTEEAPPVTRDSRLRLYGMEDWASLFNPRQLLTLVTYVEIINEAKEKIRAELGEEKAKAIATYLALVLDRCVDADCRLVIYNAARACIQKASTQHALNLMWNYPEVNGATDLWQACQEEAARDYTKVCELLGTKINSSSLNLETHTEKTFHIENASADSLFHLPDQSLDAVVTDPPYYSTIQYAELSDFFYVWQKRILGDIFPELYYSELTDKDREAVANPSRFRNMGGSPKELADQDYEAKMQMAFSEYYRVLKEDGVMTVQFNHKDSGAWNVLAKSLIDAGFEITASWAVSTENPQNLHQAQKNSVSSTVLLVCRKRQICPPSPPTPNIGEETAPQSPRLGKQDQKSPRIGDLGGTDSAVSSPPSHAPQPPTFGGARSEVPQNGGFRGQ